MIPSSPPAGPPSGTAAGRLSRQAAAAVRAAIGLAGGREVCFVCAVDESGQVSTARVVARGDVRSVLALSGFAGRGEMLVHNHPSGVLEPSEADLEVAARLHDDGVGFGIVDNAATEMYVVVEVPRADELQPIVPEEVAGALGPDGLVARVLERFEDRPNQRRMAAVIAGLYNDGGVGLIEAGTGIGKSLGYLLPALRWAALNGERTVVSTNTINLQEQLVGKDLPLLARALTDQPVRFALLKGWRNYVCLSRLEQARSSAGQLFEDVVRDEIEGLAAWAERTRDGSLTDLPAPPRPEVWDEVAAEPDLCTRLKCPFFDRCFVFVARRRAAQADVIVVNHHLLLSDVAVRRAQQNWEEAAVLPAYSRIVVDEGHHLEDAAAAHLGATATRRSLQRLFNRLERRGRGLLPALEARLAASKDLLSTASADLVAERLVPSTEAARAKATTVFDLLDVFLLNRGETVVRLTDDFATDPVWRAGLGAALDDLLGEIVLIDDGLRLVRERIESAPRRDEGAEALLGEMRAVARRLGAAGDALRAGLRPPAGAATVRWVEVRGRDRIVAVSSVPLDLAPILREDLFRRVETAVVTSATLAAESKFDFLAGRLGLDDPELAPTTAILPSPFQYARQTILAIGTDTPAPNVDASGHAATLLRQLIDLAEASNGGLFVLFTSHRDVRATAAELRARATGQRWPLLVHGEDGRDALLRRFREAGDAILLGTASFWEGVDVPGRALRGLMIAKLPFRVPTEPITAAHCEAIERRGGNAFRDYMLPHASLRLKQGFGRLIRTASDRGVVVIADPRIVTKTYGRDLLGALPPARRLIAPWSRIRPELTRFYADEEGR
ncbi:MAG TPA: helicase C-terminal domain-containing protein [Gemmatimonadaceae bacterium]|nr:helicase C-terminal domain-containing protein [Gemmatimonadaceae bacterium]